MLLDHYDALTGQIGRLTARIEELIAAIPAAQVPTRTAPLAGAGNRPSTRRPSPRVARLDEVPGIGARTAQVIIAELGLDMGQFPTPAHLVSWARLSPRTIQSGATRRAGTTGKGNPYLKGVLGEVAAAAAKTDTFLGERYRRLVRRIGKLKALVAIARSILVIVWHLLADPTARYHDLGAGYHTSRIDKDRRPAPTSANSRRWATASPSPRPPDPRPTTPSRPVAGVAALSPALARRSFSGQDEGRRFKSGQAHHRLSPAKRSSGTSEPVIQGAYWGRNSYLITVPGHEQVAGGPGMSKGPALLGTVSY